MASFSSTKPQVQVSMPSFGFMNSTGTPCAFSATAEAFQVIAATSSPEESDCSTEVMSVV